MLKSIGDNSRYKVIELLGQGSFGTVFLALDTKLSRRVALKMTNKKLDKVSIQRFQREAVVGPRLRHPNIVKIFDADVHEAQGYIVMEYLDAPDLDTLLDIKTFSIDQSIEIVAQIGAALSYLEDNCLIHRDVKPANIIVLENNRAILMDFGLVLVEDATVLTATGRVVGTPRYMAPELWFGDAYSAASDVFALGLVFHHLLVGYDAEEMQPPKPGTYSPPRPPSFYNEEVSPELDALVAWTLEGDLGLRCPNTTAFLERLASCGPSALKAVKQVKPEIEASASCDELREAKRTAEFSAIVDSRKRRRKLPFVLALLFLSCLAYFVHSHYWSRPSRLLHRNELDCNFCALPNGVVCSLSGAQDAPEYLVREGNKVIDRGKALAKGHLWVAASWELPKNRQLTFVIYQNGDEMFKKTFTLPKSKFAQAPRARAGERVALLTWKLHGRANVSVFYQWNRDKKTRKKFTSGESIRLVAPEKENELYYSLYVEDEPLYENRLVLGCVNRWDRKDGHTKPRWQLYETPVIAGEQFLISNRGMDISAMSLVRDGAGAHIGVKWLVPSLKGHGCAPLLALNSDSCLVGLHLSPNVLALANVKERSKRKEKEQGPFGTFPGEWRLEVDFSLNRVEMTKIEGTNIVGGVFRKNGELRPFSLLYPDGEKIKEPTLSVGNDLGPCQGYEVTKTRAGFLVVRLLEGEVFGHLISVDEVTGEVRTEAELSLFGSKINPILYPLPRAPDIFRRTFGAVRNKKKQTKREQKPRPELDVRPLSDKFIYVRAGRFVTFIKDLKNKLEATKRTIELPMLHLCRASHPMLIGDDRIIVGIVQSSDSIPVMSRTIGVPISIEPNNEPMEKQRVMATSGHLAGWEARCGEHSLYKGHYYFPTLEHVLVISQKTGKIARRYYSRSRSSCAFVLDETLVVPASDRSLRCVSLFDE